jgi:hypothetical protein
MRSFNQILTLLACLFSSSTFAFDASADFLYWQASESAEWALTNNFNANNQTLTYKTIGFNLAPGFRVALGQEINNWHARFSYTHFNVGANDSTTGGDGAIVPAFQAGKFTQKFSSLAQVHFTINYNILDADYFTEIKPQKNLLIRPLIGLKWGWINQDINTFFQGGLDANTLQANQNYYTEDVKNNFSGVGPKIGLESQWVFHDQNAYQSSFFANLSTSFLWGKWFLSDRLYANTSAQANQMLTGSRDFGAFMVDAILGFKLTQKNNVLKIGYEIADWFNQYQVFDNTTGARNNDLILQGLTIGLSHYF